MVLEHRPTFDQRKLTMKFFGVGVVTLIMLLTVGYMLGVIYPGFGNTLKAKIGA